MSVIRADPENIYSLRVLPPDPFRTSSVVGRPGTDWALGLEYLLAVGRARIVYKVILEKPTLHAGDAERASHDP
jgi:hypothetical protein